jgi:hypothetical protein
MSGDQNIEPPVGSQGNPPHESRFAVIGPCADKSGTHLRYGKPCPYCGNGPVEYDSSLNLVCQGCGKIQSGAFT